VKNALRNDLERLRRDALSPRHQGAFDAGRKRQPALAAHVNAASALAMLDDEAEGTYPGREALMKALIQEHRASGSPVWSTLLLGAFKPMLVRLRNRLVSDTVPGDELDQLVITSFLGTLTDIPLIDRLPMRLRQRTERQVFAFLRKERWHRHPDIDVETLEDVEHEEPTVSEPTDAELYDLALLIQRAMEEGISTSGLDVVAATVLRRELLRAYVDRLAPGEGVDRERLYQRLKRQRSRAMQRLRALLTRPSPAQLTLGF